MSKITKPGLGRGFDTLLPTNFDTSIVAEDKSRIKNVPVGQLSANKNQPRTHFDEQELQELANSLKKHGILQPLVVTAAGPSDANSGDHSNADGSHYVIVAGERRWRAAKMAGLKEVPVIVRTLKELEKLEIGLIENVQRVDLSPLEQAVSMKRLNTEFNVSIEEIGRRVGKAPVTIINIIKLLELPPEVLEALQAKVISEGHARTINALKPDVSKQLELLDLVIKRGWSVRQAEAFVIAYREGAANAKVAQKRTQSVTPLTRRLAKSLDTKVAIKPMAKGGQLMITFKSEDDLNRIIDHFKLD